MFIILPCVLAMVCDRLSYAVYMIEALLERHQNAEMFITYDIACTLQRHLQVFQGKIYVYILYCVVSNAQLAGRKDICDKIHLCLPAFHCYGHKASCQVGL